MPGPIPQPGTCSTDCSNSVILVRDVTRHYGESVINRAGAAAAIAIALLTTSACSGTSHSSAPSASGRRWRPHRPDRRRNPPLPSPTTPTASPTKLSQAGTGIKQTKVFTITAALWTLAYTYDCSSLGQGDFLAVVHGVAGTPDGVLINEIGATVSSSYVEHGAGSYYLTINSLCTWTVTVID